MMIEPLKSIMALVLGEVAEGDGYAAALQERLMRKYRGRAMAKLSVSFHLRRLERRGYVRSKYMGGCRIFKITDLGWAALAVCRGQVFPVMPAQIAESETMPAQLRCGPVTVAAAVGEADGQGTGR